MVFSKCAAPLFAAFLVLSASASSAQTNYAQQVRLQLAENLNAANELGLSLSHEPWTSYLEENTYLEKGLELNAGVRYAITGACDQDCTDVDLALYNRSGERIKSDLDASDRPLIVIEPSETAIFRIRAIMVNCSAEPCAFGVGVFSDE